MKKFLFITVSLIIILTVFIISTRNFIFKKAIIKGIKQKTNLDITIDKTNVSLKNTNIKIKNIDIYNPEYFSKRKFIEIPEIFIDYDLFKILRNEIHLKKVKLNLKQILIEKNKDGQLNINSIKTKRINKLTSEKSNNKEDIEKERKDYKLKIDNLHLKIGKIIYIEIKDSIEKKRVLTLNIDKSFKNITSFQQLKNALIEQFSIPLALNEIENIKKQFKKETLKQKLENLENNAKEILEKLNL